MTLRRHTDLEADLRRFRPQPGAAFIARFEAEVEERELLRRRPRYRIALATTMSVGMLAAFAAFGGIGYAASAAGGFHPAQVEKLVGLTNTASTASSSASAGASAESASSDQYRPGKGCGDKNHIHLRENECKKTPK